MTQNNEQSLVTVSVVTYNSANYIEATLQSVWSQSYPHIELIISDDASTDDTVAICRQWLLKHKERFVRTQIIVSEFNTGVSANRNRAEVTARGCYIKPLAGDDQLTPEAISRYVTHIESHPNIHYLFGKIEAFGDDSDYITAFNQSMQQNYSFFDLTAKEQYEQMMRNACYVPEPSFFFDRNFNDQLGIYYDEQIPMLDDWPKWIRITLAGEKLHLVDYITARYQIRNNSVSNGMQQHKSRFVAAKCQLWLRYQFSYNLHHHPRLALIKYIKVKQYLTEKKMWYILEKIGRRLNPLYRKLRNSTINDWDGYYIY